MKKLTKFSLLNSGTVFLLIVSMSLFLLAGCDSKNNKNATNETPTANSKATENQGKNGRPNADDMKKRMQDNISSLIADGTINQSQGDKILEALTANTQRFNGDRKTQNNQQTNQQNNNGNQQNRQDHQNSNGQGKEQNIQRSNPLSKLVSDGTITQAQADAVMQKVRGNFTPPQSK